MFPALGSPRGWGIAAGLLVLGLLIYSPSLPGPFVLDDFDLMEVFSAVRIGDWARCATRAGRC